MFPDTFPPDVFLRMVGVACTMLIAALIDPAYMLVPGVLALAFPEYPVDAALVGMVAVFLMGSFAKMLHGMKR